MINIYRQGYSVGPLYDRVFEMGPGITEVYALTRNIVGSRIMGNIFNKMDVKITFVEYNPRWQIYKF